MILLSPEHSNLDIVILNIHFTLEYVFGVRMFGGMFGHAGEIPRMSKRFGEYLYFC